LRSCLDDKALVKRLFLVTIAFFFACGFVSFVSANPLPMDSLWEGKPIQYVSIVVAELCGLLAGTGILTYDREVRWQKAATTVLIALVISYAIGVTIWTLGRAVGILIYNPINPFFNFSPHPLGPVVLLLPEFIGIIIGAILIHAKQKTSWKTALITMTAAMLTSFLVGILIANIYLHTI